MTTQQQTHEQGRQQSRPPAPSSIARRGGTIPPVSPDHLGPATVVPLRGAVPVALTQGTLALDLEPLLEAPDPRPRPVTVVPDPGEATPVDRALPSVEAWAMRFAQAVVEIVGGDRPVSQLVRWTSREVHQDLDRRAQLVARAGGHQPGQGRVQSVRPRVHSVHTCMPTGGSVEAAIHVRYGRRSRALAARFERHDDRWICTALDFS